MNAPSAHKLPDTRPLDGPRWAVPAAALLLVLAGLAAYANSFRVPMVLDDYPSIVDNASLRRLWPPGEVLFGATFATVVGRPVLNLSLALNYAAGGADVFGYHAVNLAIHLLAGLVLMGIVRRTLLLPAMRERYGYAAAGLAFAVALLWTLHPLQTESVTYICQRAESLAGLFYLLTLYLVIRGATAGRPRAWYAAAAITCLLGVATKETVATAPIAILLYDRTFLAGTFRAAVGRRGLLYALLAATWAPLAALVLTSGGREGSAGFGLGLSGWEYARTQFGYILRYLRLSVWPSGLVFDYGTGVASSAAEILPYAAVVAALLALTVAALRRRPPAGFAAAWVFLILVPTSSVIPLVGQVAAERRMYLPLAGVIALGVIAAWRIGCRLRGWHGHSRPYAMTMLSASPRIGSLEHGHPNGGDDHATRRICAIVSAVALAAAAFALGAATCARNRLYQSPEALWADTVSTWPHSARAQTTYGVELTVAGRYGEALDHLNQAVALDPKDALAFNNRGNVYQQLGLPALAVPDYDRALALKPAYATALSNRANAWHLLGRFDRAVDDCTRALALDPAYLDALLNRANAFMGLERYDRALADYDRAAEIAPDAAAVYVNRAVAHAMLGHLDKAWADVAAARRLGAEARPGILDLLKRRGGNE